MPISKIWTESLNFYARWDFNRVFEHFALIAEVCEASLLAIGNIVTLNQRIKDQFPACSQPEKCQEQFWL